MLKVFGRGVAKVISHRMDGGGEVARYQYGRAPPLCPRMISPRIGAEGWRANREEFMYGRAGGMG